MPEPPKLGRGYPRFEGNNTVLKMSTSLSDSNKDSKIFM